MQKDTAPRRLSQIQRDAHSQLEEAKRKLHRLRDDLMAPIRQLANETAQHFVTVLDKEEGADDPQGRWLIQGVPAWSKDQSIPIQGIRLWMDILEGDTAVEIRRARILACADTDEDGDPEPKTEIVVPRKGEGHIIIVHFLIGREYSLRRFPSKAAAHQHIESCGGRIST